MEKYLYRELNEEQKTLAYENFLKANVYEYEEQTRKSFEAFHVMFGINSKFYPKTKQEEIVITSSKSFPKIYGEYKDLKEFKGAELLINIAKLYVNNCTDVINNTNQIENPLTGFYLDDCFLEPVYKYLDINEKALNSSKEICADDEIWLNMSFMELMQRCVYNGYMNYLEDKEQYFKRFAWEEMVERRNTKFYEDGTVVIEYKQYVKEHLTKDKILHAVLMVNDTYFVFVENVDITSMISTAHISSVTKENLTEVINQYRYKYDGK